MVLVVIVQTVAAQHSEQRLFLHALVWDIGQVYACGITLILDVKTELCTFYCRGQVVHILHHQVPVALRGIVRRVLQRLHKQCLPRLGIVAGEFSHLISLSASRKLVGHS